MTVARNYEKSEKQGVQYTWWASLKHGGFLLSPSRLGAYEHFQVTLSALPSTTVTRLRTQVTRILQDRSGTIGGLLDTVLEDICGLGARAEGFGVGTWLKGTAQVGRDWSQKLMTGVTFRPQRVWIGRYGSVLPVFFDVKVPRLGIGDGRRYLSRVTEWLRKSGHRLAFATNGVQWRLIYAGLDYEAFAEWDVNFWFEEGKPSQQVDALRMLLSPEVLNPATEGTSSPLLDVIEASHRGQAEISAELGERVRRAVELLIDDLSPVLNKLESRVRPQDIYRAATRIVMRMVVILFAEARDLLPRDIAAYHDSYGINGLREILERAGGGEGEDRLRGRLPSAWPRLISLFRLIYDGSPHEFLEIRRYGGELFRPGNPDSDDPMSVALHAMEGATDEVSDRTVYRMLELLCRTRTKVRQGRSWTWVETPVDFSDLGSEYIGMLYEGLLDYELRKAGEDPVVFLSLGDQPALPISRLESLDDAAIARLIEKSKERSARVTSEEDDSSEDAEDKDAADEIDDLDEVIEEEQEAEQTEEDNDVDEEAADGDDDLRRVCRERVHAWALRAVKAGVVVRKPRSRDPKALAQYESDCEKAAQRLCSRIVLPGGWYLVRWGGTRKGSGTFYTRRELTVPTVRRTLEPLVYNISDSNSSTSGDSDKHKTVRTPEEILSIKVCDPACGSGSFLVAALEYLTDALLESLYVHGRIPHEGSDTAAALPGCTDDDSLTADLIPCPPSDKDFDRKLRARLMRHVVERCIYGVDIDPLAVELARVALWIKTMDRDLPFTFLDHKIKVGNSLVGCWLDRLEDYPVLAWSREGGDKDHSGVHYEKNVWTRAIRSFRNDRIKKEMRAWLETPETQRLHYLTGPAVFEDIHRELQEALDQVHELSVSDPEEAEEVYRGKVLGHPSLTKLKRAMDGWCALWFWPAEELLDKAPTPMNMVGDENTQAISEKIAQEFRFFHWELEFPDVFNSKRKGFDAVIGNPPWDIQKPNSKEFFSNIDPLYRSYGKQEALRKQKEYFKSNKAVERDWLLYRARFKALSNWVKNAGAPFGDGQYGKERFNLGSNSNTLHESWSHRRSRRHGYADPGHPFVHQGSADINTYKLFLEQSHAILRGGGRLGMIVPSGICTDKGTTALRNLFLNHCRWEWLFGFENRERIFDIDSRFKFCPIIVEKSGKTTDIKTAFMQRNLADWDRAEEKSLPYSKERVRRFSPTTYAILELRNKRDMEIVEKIYSNSILLGDDSPDGWKIQYATEFHMTNDSHLFPPRPAWEAQGYRPDEYGRLLKGKWREEILRALRWEVAPGIVLSQDGKAWINKADIEDVALPLYQGRMIWQYDFAAAGHTSVGAARPNWQLISWNEKAIYAQYFIPEVAVSLGAPSALEPRIVFRDVQNATNQRTMISTVLPGFPCGNKVPILRSGDLSRDLSSLPVLNSFPFDRILRMKMNQNSVNWFYVAELPIPESLLIYAHGYADFVRRIAMAGKWFAPHWMVYGDRTKSLSSQFALTPSERLRIRCILDALVAEIYELEEAELMHLLRECDWPVNELRHSRHFDPKGFWRVDKDKEPELRHTVLTLVAFHDLKRIIKDNGGDRAKGIEAFCSMNNGEGWMLPETLRLADYGLGHDERAKKPQRVRERLGPRFFPRQLEATPEESWKECEIHARNLLGEEGFNRLMKEIAGEQRDEQARDVVYTVPRDRGLGKVADAQREEQPIGQQPLLLGHGQKNLFGGQELYPTTRRERRK